MNLQHLSTKKLASNISIIFSMKFQDTSFPAMAEFPSLRDHILSEESTSFTLVGDPKQSIYSFQGWRCTIDAGYHQ